MICIRWMQESRHDSKGRKCKHMKPHSLETRLQEPESNAPFCKIKNKAQVPRSSVYRISEMSSRPFFPKATSAMSSYVSSVPSVNLYECPGAGCASGCDKK